MHIVYIDKKIILENIINEINLINIEDDIQYLNRNDGILIKGNIDIECEYLSLGVIKYFKDKVDVSILVPFENIISTDVLLKIEDFDYILKDNTISLSFKINIEGYKEIEKTFQDETKEMEIVSNVDVTLEEVKEYLDSEDIIVLEDEPKLSTKEVLVSNLNEDNNAIEENIEDIIIKNDEENNSNEKKDDEDAGKRLDFNINGEINPIKYIDTNQKVEETKKSFLDSLFKKEKKVRMMKYRVVLENDTYEEIAKEYNVNLYKLKELNHNISLELGKIIKLPTYNE